MHSSGHFLMGDTQLWAEISTKTELHYIAESLATHVLTEESATRSKDIKKVLRFSISDLEMQLYLCHKYNAPSHIIAKHEARWCEDALQLAFLARNGRLANEVRSKKKTIYMERMASLFCRAKHSDSIRISRGSFFAQLYTDNNVIQIHGCKIIHVERVYTSLYWFRHQWRIHPLVFLGHTI